MPNRKFEYNYEPYHEMQDKLKEFLNVEVDDENYPTFHLISNYIRFFRLPNYFSYVERQLLEKINNYEARYPRLNLPL